MKPDTFRLIHRVAPFEHENLDGFLSRVAVRNHLRIPFELLETITGSKTATVTVDDVPRLAYYCRNTAAEILQLSGIEKRIGAGERAWKVAGEWVTKSPFISLRRSKVCPRCLAENSYIRGLWSLNFYTVCAIHQTYLVDRCPDCMRMLKWHRRLADHCGCGYALANSPVYQCNGQEALLAKLIALRSHPNLELLPQLLPPTEINRLATLSLDGLCRTIWFLGHCVWELGRIGNGHGLLKPRPHEAEKIITHAFALLERWPSQLGEHLQSVIGERLPVGSMEMLVGLLSPANHYLHSAINIEELVFVKAAYEQYLYQFSLAYRRLKIQTPGHQLHLDFN